MRRPARRRGAAQALRRRGAVPSRRGDHPESGSITSGEGGWRTIGVPEAFGGQGRRSRCRRRCSTRRVRPTWLRALPHADGRRDRGAGASRQPGAAGTLPAPPRDRRMDRHGSAITTRRPTLSIWCLRSDLQCPRPWAFAPRPSPPDEQRIASCPAPGHGRDTLTTEAVCLGLRSPGLRGSSDHILDAHRPGRRN